MSKSGFGEHLKREREMRGVSLEEIAGATRISTRFLEALEREAWDRLPGGVFNRGFVRTVARFLGLEEESLLAEYALATHQPAPPAAAAELPARQQPLPQKSSPLALTLVVVFAVLALAAAGWYGWRWFQTHQTELTAEASVPPAPPAAPAVPSEVWDPSGFPETPEGESQQPASPWAEMGPHPHTEASTGAEVEGQLQLEIDALAETMLTVTSDGRLLFAGPIRPGERRSFGAAGVLTVEAEDAGAIRLELNGEALAPIGPLGQPGKITLGHRNLKSGPGGRN
jgi:cytoskeletal protein RodZ